MNRKLYFEFNSHDYYALLTVTMTDEDLPGSGARKAARLYVKTVGGESESQVLDEGSPEVITKSEAFYHVMKDPTIQDKPVKEVIKDFESAENDVLLIDWALL